MLARHSEAIGPDGTLVDLLIRAGDIAPDSGVVGADGVLTTWPALLERVRGLAAWLRHTGVTAGDRVVVVHPKSTESFLSMHAILAAGAIAVPVDPLGPVDRLNVILESVEAVAVITAAPTLKRLGETLELPSSAHVIVTGLAATERPPAGAIDFAAATSSNGELAVVDPDDRAYVIFTSGSTGTPKGIVHTHRSALAYAAQAATVHRLDPDARLAGTSPLHFDMSTLELYAVPLAGATAVTVRENHLLFPASLGQLIVEANVTHLYAVPYLLKQLLEHGSLGTDAVNHVTQVAFGGEQVSAGSLSSLAELFAGAELLNVYGPAEVNGIMSHSFGAPGTPITDVPIGTLWPGVAYTLIEEPLAEEPLTEEPLTDGHDGRGQVGELLVRSPSAMQGYWGDPESQFTSKGEYPTGDMVRRHDEIFYFLGRSDNRVKVRGVRIELEEIERQLGDAPGVAHVAVAVVDGDRGQEVIHAWVTPATDPAPTLANIATWARPRLPGAAVPASLTYVAAMPTTQSGKIDRRTLLAQLRDDDDRDHSN